MNYVLEGNLNFKEELLKMSNELSVEGEKCLISGEDLKKNSVKLSCNHVFNYENLFNELKNQRRKNFLEVQQLKKNEIKCPYCRKVNKGILPWYEGYVKLINVNWSNKIIHKKCLALLKSGKRKGEKCDCKAKDGNFCGRHIKKSNVI